MRRRMASGTLRRTWRGLARNSRSTAPGEFTTTFVKPDHPVREGIQPFQVWDETYVHTIYGHDERVWGHPLFHRLIRNAIHWAVQ